MKEITISLDNLSKFNRRTQKAASEILGHNVTLNQAQELFAKILGVRDYHELKTKMNQAPVKASPSKLVLFMLKEWQDLLGSENGIQLYLCKYDDQFCFDIIYQKEAEDKPLEIFCFFDNLLVDKNKNEMLKHVQQYFNETPMPEQLLNKVIAFHEKFHEVVNNENINTVRGAFFDYMAKKGIDYSTTDAFLIFDDGAWLI